LQTAEYDTDRANLEFLFRKLVSGAGRVSSNSALVVECTERMKKNLDSDSRKIERNVYVAAKKFLTKLKQESETFKSADTTASISANDSGKVGMN
jgi:hypothetical protein